MSRATRELLASLATDEAAFDRFTDEVREILALRPLDWAGYFEVAVEALDEHGDGFRVWLCCRCGADVNGRPCAEHDDDKLPGYYETWSRTAKGALVGRCYCGKNVLSYPCNRHVRRARWRGRAIAAGAL